MINVSEQDYRQALEAEVARQAVQITQLQAVIDRLSKELSNGEVESVALSDDDATTGEPSAA